MNWDLINKIRRFFRISWLKSAYLNFYMLPFHQAFKFPIIVTKYTYFYSLSGKIIINAPVRFGMLRIGFLGEDVVVPKNERALLQIEGNLIVGSNVRLGCGVIIRVEPNAVLKLCDDVRIGSKCRIIAYDSIVIGENSGISWECQIMDSNMHDITEIHSGKTIKSGCEISIGSNNWIGTRTSVMKGCITPPYTIIAASSVCSRNYEKIPRYSILAGAPAKLVKTGYKRSDFK